MSRSNPDTSKSIEPGPEMSSYFKIYRAGIWNLGMYNEW